MLTYYVWAVEASTGWIPYSSSALGGSVEASARRWCIGGFEGLDELFQISFRFGRLGYGSSGRQAVDLSALAYGVLKRGK